MLSALLPTAAATKAKHPANAVAPTVRALFIGPSLSWIAGRATSVTRCFTLIAASGKRRPCNRGFCTLARMRGRRTFAAAALSAVVLSVVVTSAATPATKPIAVTITESKVSVSSRAVNVGAAVFRVANKGKRAHRFTLGGKSTPLIGAGRSTTLRVAIPNKGPYVYYSVAPGRAPAL